MAHPPLKAYRNFIHQVLDFVDNLMSVGFVNVGTEGDFSLLLAIFRYWGDSKHDLAVEI